MRVFGGNEVHGLEGRHSQKWRFALCELDCDHAHRPNIHQLIVGLLFDELRGHPGRCPHNRFPALLLLGQLDGKAKICDLNGPILRNKDVIALEIPVYLLVFMEHLQPLQNFLHDVRTNPLGDLLDVLVNDVGERSSVHILDQHEETVHVVVRGLVVDDVPICAHRHHCCLDLNLMQDLLLGDLHHADCPALVGILPAEGLVNGAHRAFAELLGETVDLVGIFRQKVDLFDLLVELIVSQEGVIRDLFLLLEASHDLDHDLRVVLDYVLADVVFAEELHHFRSKAFDAARTVEIHLQMHLMLEILRPKFWAMITC